MRATTIQVLTATGAGASTAATGASTGGGNKKNNRVDGGEGEGEVLLPSLACDACAARNFPETSVHPAGQVRFRYGDDGPVAAVDVALEIPRVQVRQRRK